MYMDFKRLYPLFIIILLITFGTIGGCGNGDGDEIDNGGELAGEQNCTDDIDNDNDGDSDCDDVDCILNPACLSCKDFLDTLCSRFNECSIFDFEACISEFSNLKCNNILEIPDKMKCIEDLENSDCETLNNNSLPDTCYPTGACNLCERLVEGDCPDGLSCQLCVDDCGGDVNSRCSWARFNVRCEDGIYGPIL